ncbi:MAG: hypothetical protein EBZ61_09540, partial [Micrococcales bacterium]|nr:hypothetical protein [Micrococcales bacterium]
ADLTAGDAPRAVTVNELFEDALTISTYTNANINNISYGTSTGTRLVSTNASITTGTIPSLTSSTASITIGTIPTLTAGTTTSTAANITNGTIQTLTASTATITGGTFSGLLNSSTGTFSGAINSTVGTIGNFTTTLAGDITISTGTATVSTRVAVVNTAQEYTAAHNFNATSLTISTGSTIAWDLATNQVAKLTVTTNSTLSTPTNPVDGATYMLVVTQGTAGNNTLSFSTAYKFPGGSAPVLSTGSADDGVTSQDFS